VGNHLPCHPKKGETKMTKEIGSIENYVIKLNGLIASMNEQQKQLESFSAKRDRLMNNTPIKVTLNFGYNDAYVEVVLPVTTNGTDVDKIKAMALTALTAWVQERLKRIETLGFKIADAQTPSLDK
jgi:hypothetical protein